MDVKLSVGGEIIPLRLGLRSSAEVGMDELRIFVELDDINLTSASCLPADRLDTFMAMKKVL